MTREEARIAAFYSGVKIKDLPLSDFPRLRNIIDKHMKESKLMNDTLRMEKNIKSGWGYVGLTCKSYYFDNREAVTFNGDGFIGFAGWSDEVNVQPILAGFCEWISSLK